MLRKAFSKSNFFLCPVFEFSVIFCVNFCMIFCMAGCKKNGSEGEKFVISKEHTEILSMSLQQFVEEINSFDSKSTFYCEEKKNIPLKLVFTDEELSYDDFHLPGFYFRNVILDFSHVKLAASPQYSTFSLFIPMDVRELYLPQGCYDFYLKDNNSLEILHVPAECRTIHFLCCAYLANLKEVDIPKNSVLEKIDDLSFSNCVKLEKINLPDSLKEIGNEAFANCSSLKKVNLSNVEKIRDSAFRGCIALENVRAPKAEEIGYHAFYECSSVKKANVVSCKDVSAAFDNCRNLRKIVLGDHTEMSESFEGCCKLNRIKCSNPSIKIKNKILMSSDETILYFVLPSFAGRVLNIPESFLYYAPGAFSVCKAKKVTNIATKSVSTWGTPVLRGMPRLEEYELSEKLAEFSPEMFKDCKNLKKAVFFEPANNFPIYERAFSGCDGIEEVTFPADFTGVYGGDSYSFKSMFNNCQGLKKVVFPSTTLKIAQGMFQNCKNLEDVVVSSHLIFIDSYAFDGCAKLKAFELPDGLLIIGISAFSGCSSFEKIVVPSTVETIKDGAFSNCTSLKSINVLGKITRIADKTFSNCTALTEIHLPDSLKTIGTDAFCNCISLKQIELPSQLIELDTSVFSTCTSLSTVIFNGTVTDFAKIKLISTESHDETSRRIGKIGNTSLIQCTDGVVDLSDVLKL